MHEMQVTGMLYGRVRQLTGTLRRFVVQDAVWQSMSAAERDDHETAFNRRKDHASGTTVTSSDGLLTVPNVQQMATKPSQRRHRTAERARGKLT